MSEDIHGPHWILSFQNGVEQAFRDVYDLWYKPLVYYAGYIITDKQEAEQIVLDSFIKLWDRRPGFEKWEQIKAFLRITTKNACLNFLKSNDRQTRLGREAAMHAGYNESSVEENLVRAEVMLEVYTAIEELPPECKAIFKLIFLHGLTNIEIAERKGIAVQTVRTQKAKALQVLRAKLFEKWLRDENAGH